MFVFNVPPMKLSISWPNRTRWHQLLGNQSSLVNKCLHTLTIDWHIGIVSRSWQPMLMVKEQLCSGKCLLLNSSLVMQMNKFHRNDSWKLGTHTRLKECLNIQVFCARLNWSQEGPLKYIHKWRNGLNRHKRPENANYNTVWVRIELRNVEIIVYFVSMIGI